MFVAFSSSKLCSGKEMTPGEKFAELRNRNGYSQPMLAAEAGCSDQSISDFESGRTSKMRAKPWMHIARVFKMDVPALNALIFESGAAGKLEQLPTIMDALNNLADNASPERRGDVERLREAFRELAKPTAGVDIDTVFPVPPIPVYDANVAACRWIPCDKVYEHHTGEQARLVDRGEFIVRITGDCMEPFYNDGSQYQFRIVRLDKEAWPQGSDCLIFSSDEQVTFKRLYKVTEDTVTLYPLNAAKYPDAMTIPTQMVCRVAVVVKKIEVVQPPAFKPAKRSK